jgi:hypothetical protein
MYFGTCNVYDFSKDEYKKLTCMMCLMEEEQTNDPKINAIVTLHKNSIQNYFKQCSCKIVTHLVCLDIWLNKCKKCPICKNKMYKDCEVDYYHQSKLLLVFFLHKNVALFFFLFVLGFKYIFLYLILDLSNGIYSGFYVYTNANANFRNLH